MFVIQTNSFWWSEKLHMVIECLWEHIQSNMFELIVAYWKYRNLHICFSTTLVDALSSLCLSSKIVLYIPCPTGYHRSWEEGMQGGLDQDSAAAAHDIHCDLLVPCIPVYRRVATAVVAGFQQAARIPRAVSLCRNAHGVDLRQRLGGFVSQM